MGDTYRRDRLKKQKEHTRWELTYGTIAAKLLRSRRINPSNITTVSKFLGAFVYVFSIPYTIYKTLRLKLKVAKIKSKGQKE